MFQELSNGIKIATIHWNLTLQLALWSFGSPPRLLLPKWELPWECECSLSHTPSHFLKLPGVLWWLPGFLLARTLLMPLPSLSSFLPFSLQPCHAFALTLGLLSFWLATLQPLALVASPKLRLQHFGPPCCAPTIQKWLGHYILDQIYQIASVKITFAL